MFERRGKQLLLTPTAPRWFSTQGLAEFTQLVPSFECPPIPEVKEQARKLPVSCNNETVTGLRIVRHLVYINNRYPRAIFIEPLLVFCST